VLTTSVALGESVDFDATQLDPDTVVFGPGQASPERNAAIEDVDGDGDVDLVFHFRTQELDLQCGDVSAQLEGRTWDGEEVAGEDSVRIVPCK
jgi:hypothetical protein